MTNLTAYRVGEQHLDLAAARADRDWMDRFQDRHPYRCLPLTIANQWGWELRAPCDIEAEWTGAHHVKGLIVTCDMPKLAVSHFGGGILTIHPGFIFRTSPGWGMRIDGPANWPKDGIAPLTGIVETDWLPFTSTLNWAFTRPGKIRFQAGEPLAVISPIQLDSLTSIQPRIAPIEADPDLAAEYHAWRASRDTFNAALLRREITGWQKTYHRGNTATGASAPQHRTKLKLAEPLNG